MTREPYRAVNLDVPDLGALRAWLTAVAPGMLISRGAISLAFVVAPGLTGLVQVAAVTRAAAAVLLLAQVFSTVSLLRRPGRRSLGVFVTVLAIDFLLCGILLGSERQLWGVGVPVALVALAVSFEVAGWVTVVAAAGLIGTGFAAAVWLGIGTPLMWPDTLMFGTVLSVETSFAGTPAVGAAAVSFPTALHVETAFGGVSGLGWTTALLLPALALVLVALALGAAVNVVRVRRACAAPPGMSLRRGGMAGLGLAMLLFVSVSTAGAQCDPSGRAAFVEGLEVLSHGDLPAATRIFFQLAQAQPACPEVHNNLAVLFVEQDRLDEAARQLQRALQLNPDYERARVNLARVEALLKERQGHGDPVAATAVPQPTPSPQPSPRPVHLQEGWPGGTAVVVAPGETQAVEGTPTDTPRAEPTSTQAKAGETGTVPSAPPSAAAAARRPAAVCVIEPAQNRICVYQLGEGTAAPQECYAIAVAQVRWWPRSLVASEVTAQQIRLLDESGQTRLEIVPEDAKVSGDALRLRSADWQALAAKVIPWRTAWLIAE